MMTNLRNSIVHYERTPCMSESNEVEVYERVVVAEEVDRPTRWLIWAVSAVALFLVALIAYGLVSGSLSERAPATREEDALASTAAAIAADPADGMQYAIRAETLYSLGKTDQAFEVLDQGEKAVAGENPALLYILRARTAILNQEGEFKEAVEVGTRAMTASDDYLAKQGLALAQKGVTGISGNMKVTASVDTAIQVAAAYMGVKDYDKALELYDYALRLEPTAGDILALRGWAYLDAGKEAEAKADFEQVLQYLPDDESALSGLEQLSK